MADDHMIGVEADLREADLREVAGGAGRRENCSSYQHPAHLTRPGSELSAHEAGGQCRIAAVVREETPASALASEERLAANVELDVTIRERAATAFFGRALLKEGIIVVALDDNGVLAEFDSAGASRPHGTRPVLSQGSQLLG